jgi:YfiH family protein
MSTRVGGVSVGPFASLNIGKSGGDDADAVDENRRRVLAALGAPAAPGWIRQVHGATVVEAPFEGGPEADAVFTTRAGVICAVQAADCLPVLFCDDDAGVVAAAHAGWRGLAAGVLEATVKVLPARPGRVMAWLGAAIGPGSFEVGAEVREAFTRVHAADAGLFKPLAAPGKFLADLYALARRRLERAGVARVFGGGRDTFGEPETFFSWRRDRTAGRQAAYVWLDPRKDR